MASIIFSAFPASFLSAFTAFLDLVGMIYLGSKFFSTSMPRVDLGKSLICPKLDSTLKPRPRKRVIVLAFVGDSTITKFIPLEIQPR